MIMNMEIKHAICRGAMSTLLLDGTAKVYGIWSGESIGDAFHLMRRNCGTTLETLTVLMLFHQASGTKKRGPSSALSLPSFFQKSRSALLRDRLVSSQAFGASPVNAYAFIHHRNVPHWSAADSASYIIAVIR